MVKITLHGHLGESVGSNWNLAVKTVSEAIRAIEVLSGRKLFKYLLEQDKKGAKYRVLVNNRDFRSSEEISLENPESLRNSELCIKVTNLESIDIVPILQGADEGILQIVAGVVLVVVGIVLSVTGVGSFLTPYLVTAGLGLVAGGVITLLTQPPKFEDFRDFEEGGGRQSYLFNGPTNTINEGGPVFIGYGRLLIGSHVLGSSFEVSHQSAKEDITQ